MPFYKAKHRYADVSARNIRPFAQLVRGKNVDEALEQLQFIHNRGARQLEAVIKSAIGNADDQGCKDLDELIVSECRVDDGPMFKRMQPRARGTAFTILRRLSHIVVTLADPESLGGADDEADDATETVTGPEAAATTHRGSRQPLLRSAVAIPLMVSWMHRLTSSSSSPSRRRRSISTCRWCSGSR